MSGSGDVPLFTPDQCRALGLGEHESVRLLSRTGRTLVLETSHENASPLPWDRELVLSADVRAFPIADVLHLIHAAAKSGFLFFENGEHEKSVFLHRGEVVFAASNQQVDRLIESLLRRGVISREQHREAAKAYRVGRPIGKTLVERGVLTAREVWNGVKGQIEEIVRSLFAYGSGNLHFWEGEVRPDNVVRLSLPTRRLIAEGLRCRDELLKQLARYESPRVQLVAVPERAQDLSSTEREVYHSLEQHPRFVAMCRKAGVDPLSGARTVTRLCDIGAVRVEQGGSDGADWETTDVQPSEREAVRACVVAHVGILSELVAPIIAVEGPEGIRLRLERVIREGARRFPELLSDLELTPAGVLDPEQVVERVLRFPGDREREVGLAFGELISYLEFELANHPKIDDPEVFLEAIEDLRLG